MLLKTPFKNATLFILLIFGISFVSSFKLLLVAFLFSVYSFVVSSKDTRKMLKTFASISLFSGFVSVCLLIFGSVEDSIRVLLRSFSMLLLTISLFNAYSPVEVLESTMRFVPSDKLRFIMVLSYSFVRGIIKDLACLNKSLKSRHFHLRTSVFSYKTMAMLISSLLLKGKTRSEGIYKSMIARGFSSDPRCYNIQANTLKTGGRRE